MENKSSGFKIAGWLLIILALVCVCLGFYKMKVYESGDYSWSDPKNAYVGGDAYNYIINGNYATGYFVLSMGTLVSSVVCFATDGILSAQKAVAKANEKPNSAEDQLPSL